VGAFATARQSRAAEMALDACRKDWQIVFTNEHGRLISARDWSRDAWHPALRKAGITPGRMNGQHNLRHAFVAVLIDGGASAQQVRDYCGHSSIKTTLDVYGHLFERSHDRARSIIDDTFSAGVYPLRTVEGQ
jgi:integrase